MAVVPRYNPRGGAIARPMPRPELGRGAETSLAALQQGFSAVTEFLRPAVIKERTDLGERQAIEAIRENRFQPAKPFTVRDQAFNAAADVIVTTKTMSLLDERIKSAIKAADGDVGRITKELQSVRAEIGGNLPQLDGLATDFEVAFERASMSAVRKTAQIAEARRIAKVRAAAAEALETASSQAQTLALTGASEADLAAAIAEAQDKISVFGPREEFTVGGITYPANPNRQNILSPGKIDEAMQQITRQAQGILVEAQFQNSDAPGQFVQDFKRRVFEGNSPFEPGESLKMILNMEGRARAWEARRRAEAKAELARLDARTDTVVNAYTSMTEAGVPVAIPEEDRRQIIEALSPFPERQREAEIQFAVADAYVDTFGMSAADLSGYIGSVRSEVEGAIERGEVDQEGVAVILALQDKLSKISDALTAEEMGLPMIEQMIADGENYNPDMYDGLREQAAGNSEIVKAINETEAFHRDVENMKDMTAEQRKEAIEQSRRMLQERLQQGRALGADGVFTMNVIDRLSEWSVNINEKARNDPMKFASIMGIQLPAFDEEATLPDVANTIAQRVEMLRPVLEREGVSTSVPISQAEVEAITEFFDNSPRLAQLQFLGTISELGEDQASAVFEKIGEADPIIYAAGEVFSNGNRGAASLILRGRTDIKLPGGDPVTVASARTDVVGPLMETDILTPESMEKIDAAAMAYARGAVMSRGGEEVTARDIKAGYKAVLGGMPDGTGGVQEVGSYGVTILPRGWTGRQLSNMIRNMDDEAWQEVAGGEITDYMRRPFTAKELRRTIGSFRPYPGDPWKIMPLDQYGGVFLTPTGPLVIDLREIGG